MAPARFWSESARFCSVPARFWSVLVGSCYIKYGENHFGEAIPEVESKRVQQSPRPKTIPKLSEQESKPTQILNVSIYNNPHLVNTLHEEVKIYRGGNVSSHFKKWQEITTDVFVLDSVKYALKLDLSDIPLSTNSTPTCSLGREEKINIATELTKLLQKKVIQYTTYQIGDFVSSIFTRTKSDGSYRMILNLKRFNKFVAYKHCKLESFQDVLTMVTPGVWMGSVDLKDAYYSIPVHKEHQKYLKFYFEGDYLQFTCLPNGYAQALRAFTKILKQPFGYLRKLGHTSVIICR